MDTITHGIAGALLGKAFGGEDLLTSGPLTRRRIVTWSLMLGAIFPDADVFRDMLSRNELLVLTWHRSITHSLLCLPVFALALAGLTRWIASRKKWVAPSFALLTLIYAVGILSHILLDLVTSFGTMIWSPLSWARPAWDLIFIVDFTLSAIFLAPQMVAWVYARPEGLQRRALGSLLAFGFATLGVAALGRAVDAPVSLEAILASVVVFSAIFLLPAVRNVGLRVSRANWARAGVVIALIYIAGAFYAHRVALAEVQKFAAEQHIDVQSLGALPLPPSLWHWDGLVRAPRGVYETRIDFDGHPDQLAPASGLAATALPIEYRFYPDAPMNSYIAAAKQLREVQIVLWFSRFPVTRFHKEGAEAVVEFSDLRFPHVRRDRPASFTYRVRFGSDGAVTAKGWAKN